MVRETVFDVSLIEFRHIEDLPKSSHMQDSRCLAFGDSVASAEAVMLLINHERGEKSERS